MARRFLSEDPTTGIRRYYHDDNSSQFQVETEQDVNPIVDSNAAQRNPTSRNTRWGEGIQKVATIPLAVMEDMIARGILTKGGAVQDRAALRRWLNDPDNRAFRTREGKV